MIPVFTKKILEYFWEESVLPIMRWIFWDKRIQGHPYSEKVFASFEHYFKLARNDFFLNRLPEFSEKKTEKSWIPVNKKIKGLEEIALHEEILFRIIEKAKHRVIVHWCGCRRACKCQKHDRDIGCLMIGEGALQIPEKSRSEVGIDEAKEHVRKAVANGLLPITGKVRVDNTLYMIPDKNKLLTICFCCACCCIARFFKHIPVERMDQMLRPIEGLYLEFNQEACVGCGKCVSNCYGDAIKIVNKKAVRSDRCRICGRCAMTCPNDAIVLKAENSNPTELVINRIDAYVDY